MRQFQCLDDRLKFCEGKNLVDVEALTSWVFGHTQVLDVLCECIAQQKVIYVDIVPADSIPTFAVFSNDTIKIGCDLNLHEIKVSLLFELCNIANLSFLAVRKNILNYSCAQDYAEACERAEFQSIERAKAIYDDGVTNYGWPKIEDVFEKLKPLVALYQMNETEYLAWSKLPGSNRDGAHFDFYVNTYEDKKNRVIQAI